MNGDANIYTVVFVGEVLTHHLGPSSKVSSSVQQHFSGKGHFTDHQCVVRPQVQAEERPVPAGQLGEEQVWRHSGAQVQQTAQHR